MPYGFCTVLTAGLVLAFNFPFVPELTVCAASVARHYRQRDSARTELLASSTRRLTWLVCVSVLPSNITGWVGLSLEGHPGRLSSAVSTFGVALYFLPLQQKLW